MIDNGTNLINLSYNNTSGQLSRIEKDNGLFLSYDYDGGLTLSEESNYGKVEFEYDNNLRVTKVKAKNNEISYDFNDDDELTTAGDVEYQHDEYGFVKKATLGDITENYYYNKYGEVYKTETFYQNNLLYSLEMSYNSVGMIVERVEKRLNETNTFTYTYDNANQLVEVFKNGTIINSYTYDDNGNRLSETTPNGVVNGRYDNQDRMSAYGSNVYSYTDRGSLKQKITSEGTTTYNYDFQGNLLTVTTPAKQIEYIVDARNRRIAKKVNGVVTQKFLYLNQLEPIAELDANDNIVSLFVYGTRSNTPEYIIKGGVKYKVITNQLGSVVMIVNVSNGTVEQSIEYDSFGNILSDSAPNFQPFRLAGGLYDVDTQLTRFGARDYDAREGRWTSKDPIKFDGGRNFYVYAENNPVNYVDITGLNPTKGMQKIRFYNSPDEAAIEGFTEILCNIYRNSFYRPEFTFDVIRYQNGLYNYTQPITKGSLTGVNIGQKSDIVYADSHSHGLENDGNMFSGIDIYNYRVIDNKPYYFGDEGVGRFLSDQLGIDYMYLLTSKGDVLRMEKGQRNSTVNLGNIQCRCK